MESNPTHFTELLEGGFAIRPATMEDLEISVELFNICSLDFIGEPEVSLHEVHREWELDEFDLARSTHLVFSPQGELVGYIEVWDINTPPVDNWAWGRVHPEWENHGIGTAMMSWARHRARQAIPRCPQHARVIMRSGAHHTHKSGLKLLQDQGMKLIRHSYRMWIDLNQSISEPLWPSGIALRPYDHDRDSRQVFAADVEAFRDHWGFVEQPFEEEYHRWLHMMTSNPLDFDPSLWFIAVDGDEIAGISLCLPSTSSDPDMGWLDTLAVRAPWRRQGLGLALLRHSFREFRQRGKLRAGLGVDASNLTGATRLYERAGMKILRQFDIFEEELRPGEDLTVQELT